MFRQENFANKMFFSLSRKELDVYRVIQIIVWSIILKISRMDFYSTFVNKIFLN